VDFGPDGFDPKAYAHFADPRNADLHMIVPGKLVAFKSPRALPPGILWQDTPDGSRAFSPEHFSDILDDLDVCAVVRLNLPCYDARVLEAAGVAVVDLRFDGDLPPPDVAAKFLLLARALPGAIAVHCDSGLGRTGALAALYLMGRFGFGAREAVAWVRTVRPGSVSARAARHPVTLGGGDAWLRSMAVMGTGLRVRGVGEADDGPFSVGGGVVRVKALAAVIAARVDVVCTAAFKFAAAEAAAALQTPQCGPRPPAPRSPPPAPSRAQPHPLHWQR
jgi:hypothetical protein